MEIHIKEHGKMEIFKDMEYIPLQSRAYSIEETLKKGNFMDKGI